VAARPKPTTCEVAGGPFEPARRQRFDPAATDWVE
jgi:hypothetical protein